MKYGLFKEEARSVIPCSPDIIPLGWAFAIPSRTGWMVVSAAFNISMTDNQEKDRRVDLIGNEIKLIRKDR